MEIIIAALLIYITFKFDLMSGLISRYKKSEAAASIEMLLERQKQLLYFDGNPALAANQYVQEAWSVKQTVFDGKFGKRPHKLAVILYSLACAARKLDEPRDKNLEAILLSLSNVAAEIQANGKYYGLSSVDHALIEEAMQITTPIFQRENDKFSALNGEIQDVIDFAIGDALEKRSKIEAQGIPYIHHNPTEGVFQMVDFPYQRFEDWYAVYRQAAFKANPAIAPSINHDGKSVSIIDFLDSKPCMMAYRHHLAPEPLGKRFGEIFDINEIELPDGTKTGDIANEILSEKSSA